MGRGRGGDERGEGQSSIPGPERAGDGETGATPTAYKVLRVEVTKFSRP